MPQSLMNALRKERRKEEEEAEHFFSDYLPSTTWEHTETGIFGGLPYLRAQRSAQRMRKGARVCARFAHFGTAVRAPKT